VGARHPTDLPIVPFESGRHWDKWLKSNHASSPGVWLKIAKAGSGVDSVTYPQALETALCYGWIDGQKESFDARFWLQRFTPRKTGSRWSRINREKATRLIEEGRMRPAGLRQIEVARENGAWDGAYHSQAAASVPDDLARRLKDDPAARKFFEGLDSANRYAILYRIHEAKKPETRAKRIEKFMGMLREKKKIHPG
jgi:uncharacterized protein YdeI (YjbR/CyaY-like superfamily)